MSQSKSRWFNAVMILCAAISTTILILAPTEPDGYIETLGIWFISSLVFASIAAVMIGISIGRFRKRCKGLLSLGKE